eukprot:1936173-Rhodomonas_salina.1
MPGTDTSYGAVPGCQGGGGRSRGQGTTIPASAKRCSVLTKDVSLPGAQRKGHCEVLPFMSSAHHDGSCWICCNTADR